MEKVDKFLYLILKNQNCSDGEVVEPSTAADFLQKSEENIISFIQKDDRSELEFPPLNSFYRRIIHCLGRRYNLVHRVEVTNIFNSNSTLRKIYLTKPIGDQKLFQGPILKSSDWILEIERETGIIETSFSLKKVKKVRNKKSIEEKLKPAIPKIKILKRETAVESSKSSVPTSPLLTLENLSLEEREAKYQAVRDRIFEGFTSKEDENETVIDYVDNGVDAAISDNILDTIYNITPNTINDDYPTNASNDHPFITTVASTLNPEAVPFTFTPVFEEPVTEPDIKINHIYTVIPKEGQLTRDHLKEILAVHPTATIKTHIIPADSAFLILKDNNNTTAAGQNDKWIISNWIPEFYLD